MTDHNAEHDRLEALTQGKECVRCEQKPNVSWQGKYGVDAYILRCGCWPTPPKLVKQPHRVTRRLGRMVRDRALSTGEGGVEDLFPG